MPSQSIPKTPYELWSQNKPSLRHFHVLGWKVEVRPYNQQSKKLDPKTINGYFIGYCVGSRGSRFYWPSFHTTRVIESDRAIYFCGYIGTSQGPREIVFKEHPVFILVPIASASIISPVVDQHPIATPGNEPIEEVYREAPNVLMEIPLRRSKRVSRLAISYDYIVYLK